MLYSNMSQRPKKLDLNQLEKRIVDETIGEETITLSPGEKHKKPAEAG